ncbi:B12-binding domain-containing radical SAM protein [Sedimenticola hydrogenitrophicus]|uniref:B12-binding domain-containing radical SAM protein n=1 Tax=Sedimenticola hydrogenitrophicus TaxID=2967975 RepID=UPI0023B04688|nr:B12-binding domain-containing radical SAM protein [Sedimenticola hydrogenitrophicus]
MPEIILATLNARHIHASLGLRYLYANLGDLQPRAAIREFTIDPWPIDIAERLLAERPRIIGLGVYIWNAERSRELVALLKQVSPETLIVLGGPEVSHEWQDQPIVAQADYLITGQGDLAFARLCERLLRGERPAQKVIEAPPPPLESLQLPYAYYTEQDIAQRLIYVEASRGCPFKCEFCLSALDRSARPFTPDSFMQALEQLHQRGVRHFKFVDRTFNLNPQRSVALLEFFLERLDERLFLHFEVIPDHLPQRLRDTLRRFPAGSLQLEIGIQSFNPEVQGFINRKQDNEQSRANLQWLRTETRAHLHADLIIGLPGEDLESFARGFDQLAALAPHEIQVGVLKRLKGSPIIRHSEPYRMRYNPAAPYNVLSTDRIDFPTMQRLNRFARYWEMIANSGRFRQTLPLLLGEQPFERFMRFSDWLFDTTGQVHRIALKRLFELLHDALTGPLSVPAAPATQALEADFSRSGIKGRPAFLPRQCGRVDDAAAARDRHSARQARHH